MIIILATLGILFILVAILTLIFFCYKPSLSMKVFIAAAIILGVLGTNTATHYSTIVTETIVSDSTLVEAAKKEIAFEDSVLEYIKFININHPEIVFKQARVESGNFKSGVWKNCNNMFGMTFPEKRPNLAIGKYRVVSDGKVYYFAKFKNWQDCVVDYALYQTYTAKGLNREDYLKHLGNSYAEDPNYKDKVK